MEVEVPELDDWESRATRVARYTRFPMLWVSHNPDLYGVRPTEMMRRPVDIHLAIISTILIYLSISISIYLLSIYPSIYLSIYLISICLSIYRGTSY